MPFLEGIQARELQMGKQMSGEGKVVFKFQLNLEMEENLNAAGFKIRRKRKESSWGGTRTRKSFKKGQKESSVTTCRDFRSVRSVPPLPGTLSSEAYRASATETETVLPGLSHPPSLYFRGSP